MDHRADEGREPNIDELILSQESQAQTYN